MLKRLIVLWIAYLMPASPACTDSPSNINSDKSIGGFITCLGSSGSTPICELAYGVHTISSTIYVDRSNVQIRTECNDYGDRATIRREANWGTGSKPLLQINADRVGITVKNLVFAGRRAGNGISSYPYTTYGTVGGMAIDDYADDFYDINIEPTTSSSPSTTLLDNLVVFDSVGYGILVQRPNTTIQYSQFNSGFLSAVKGYDHPSYPGPTGVIIQNNLIYYWGGSGIASDGGNNWQILTNTVANCHREFPHRTACGGGLCPGGQIYVEYSSATIDNNWIDGYYTNANYLSLSEATSGLEVYGNGHVIKRNTIFAHGRDGIGLHGSNSVTIGGSSSDKNTVQSNGYLHYSLSAGNKALGNIQINAKDYGSITGLTMTHNDITHDFSHGLFLIKDSSHTIGFSSYSSNTYTSGSGSVPGYAVACYSSAPAVTCTP